MGQGHEGPMAGPQGTEMGIDEWREKVPQDRKSGRRHRGEGRNCQLEERDSREEVDRYKREVGQGQHLPKIRGRKTASRLGQGRLTERVCRHLGDKSEHTHKGESRWEWAALP